MPGKNDFASLFCYFDQWTRGLQHLTLDSRRRWLDIQGPGQQCDSLGRLVDRRFDLLQYVVSIVRIERDAELRDARFQILILHRLLVGTAQRLQSLLGDVRRSGGEPRDLALRRD